VAPVKSWLREVKELLATTSLAKEVCGPDGGFCSGKEGSGAQAFCSCFDSAPSFAGLSLATRLYSERLGASAGLGIEGIFFGGAIHVHQSNQWFECHDAKSNFISARRDLHICLARVALGAKNAWTNRNLCRSRTLIQIDRFLQQLNFGGHFLGNFSEVGELEAQELDDSGIG